MLVVDDVVTTGATLRSAADALRRAGAHTVVRAALATTPAVLTRCDDRTGRTRRRSAEVRTSRRETVVHGPWAA